MSDALQADKPGSRRIAITVEQAETGEWVMPAVSYVDPARRFCAMTGRPIARRYWRVTVGTEEVAFAGPAEALLCATYPMSAPMWEAMPASPTAARAHDHPGDSGTEADTW